jgi:hypothetical protein
MPVVVVEGQCCEVASRPPIATVGWITDDARAAGPQQSAGDAQDDQWGSETPSRHHVNGTALHRAIVTGGDHGLHVGGHDLDPIGQIERADAVPEQIGSLLAALDEREVNIRPIDSDHEAGEPAAGTEVDDDDVDPGDRFGQCGDETPSVCDGRIDRPAADRAAALDLGENSGE